MRNLKAGVILLLTGAALAFDNPTFLGPVFSVPRNPGQNTAWPSVVKMIAANLTAAIAAANGGMEANSLAVRAISVSDTDPFVEFHHSATSISSAGVQIGRAHV